MFRLAQRYQPEAGWKPHLYSTQGGLVRLNDAVAVETQRLPADLGDYDAIILPGFFAESLDHIVSQLQTTWHTVIARLQRLPETTLVAASCYGTFVLAEAGLLNGLPATTTWWLAHEFQQRYPNVLLDADKTLVDSGRAITAGAMTAHTDLSLHVLRRLGGVALARSVSGIMLVDGARTSQRPFMSVQKDYSEPLIQRAIEWMTGKTDAARFHRRSRQCDARSSKRYHRPLRHRSASIPTDTEVQPELTYTPTEEVATATATLEATPAIGTARIVQSFLQNYGGTPPHLPLTSVPHSRRSTGQQSQHNAPNFRHHKGVAWQSESIAPDPPSAEELVTFRTENTSYLFVFDLVIENGVWVIAK